MFFIMFHSFNIGLVYESLFNLMNDIITLISSASSPGDAIIGPSVLYLIMCFNVAIIDEISIHEERNNIRVS